MHEQLELFDELPDTKIEVRFQESIEDMERKLAVVDACNIEEGGSYYIDDFVSSLADSSELLYIEAQLKIVQEEQE